jgi:hypothetical protein
MEVDVLERQTSNGLLIASAAAVCMYGVCRSEGNLAMEIWCVDSNWISGVVLVMVATVCGDPPSGITCTTIITSSRNANTSSFVGDKNTIASFPIRPIAGAVRRFNTPHFALNVRLHLRRRARDVSALCVTGNALIFGLAIKVVCKLAAAQNPAISAGVAGVDAMFMCCYGAQNTTHEMVLERLGDVRDQLLSYAGYADKQANDIRRAILLEPRRARKKAMLKQLLSYENRASVMRDNADGVGGMIESITIINILDGVKAACVNQISITLAEKTMDDVHELLQDAREMQSILSTPAYEIDIEEELAELEACDRYNPATALPAPPTHTPIQLNATQIYSNRQIAV